VSDPGARPSLADRIGDPASHFPYHYDKAMRAAVDEAHQAEIGATRDYVQAQQAYLEAPGDETRQAERDAAGALQQIRQDRRVLRETPALIQALEAEAQAAEVAQDHTRLDLLEQALTDAISRARGAADRLGVHPADDGQKG
jgi:hypothetical protein